MSGLAADNESNQVPADTDKNNGKEAADITAGVEALSTEDTLDSDLFGPFPPRPECPICLIPLPEAIEEMTYSPCCGMLICTGCDYVHATTLMEENTKRSRKKQPTLKKSCPFCRAPVETTHGGLLKRFQKRVDLNDATSIYMMGGHYLTGGYNLQQDERKAMELLLRAAELGSSEACVKISGLCAIGKDEAKARKYAEIAARKGNAEAYYILGLNETQKGNKALAMRHFRVAAAAGDNDSLTNIKEGYKDGHVSKDEYTESLRAHQHFLDEEKSEERDRASAWRKNRNKPE